MSARRIRASRALASLLSAAAAAAPTSSAAAQPTTEATAGTTAVSCVAAAEDAQLRRRDGHLRAARETLLVCGRESCPAEVRADCVRWLAEVDHAIPSISVAVRDADGHDVGQAAVLLDGVPYARGLATASIPLDPGLHRVRIETFGSAPLEESVLLRPGEQDRVITFALPRPAAPVTSRPSRLTPQVLVSGAITAAAGAAALVFGIKAVADRHALDDACPHCTPGAITEVKTEAAACDVALGAFALGAFATTWLLLRPTSAPDRPVAGATLWLTGEL